MGEVLPGDGRARLQAEQLHQEHQEAAGEAEGPAEDAPVGRAVAQLSAVHDHREGHTGEDHGGDPGPQERAGVEHGQAWCTCVCVCVCVCWGDTDWLRAFSWTVSVCGVCGRL